MTVLLSSRNFQNSVMGLNSSSKKFPQNVLFRNAEGSPDFSTVVESQLNHAERYKRNSNVLIPSKDGKSMEVYKVFEDDGSGTVILTREGSPKKEGEGPEIFMKKVSKSELLKTNPLTSVEKSAEVTPNAVESASTASPEQIAQVETVPADPKLERALDTVIADVDTDKGIEEARLALEAASNSSTWDVTRASSLISDQFDASSFHQNRENQFSPTLSTGEGISLKDMASLNREEPRISFSEKDSAFDTSEGKYATDWENHIDEELDLDEDEPHMVLDSLLKKFEQSPTFDSAQADSFKKVISRLPKNEQGPMYQEIIDRIKIKREKQDAEHYSKIESALKNSPAAGRFEGITTSTDEELDAEDLERGRLHDSGEIWDSNIAYFNKKKRTQKINELGEKIKTLLAQEQGYLLDGAEEDSPVLRLVDRELSALNKNIEKLYQEQKAEDLRGESYKKEDDIDMSGFDEYVDPTFRTEVAPPLGPTAPETPVDQAEAPKPVAKKKGLFGKIASGFAAVGLALGLASGGGKNIEKHTPESEPAGPAPASDLSMSTPETGSPLVSSEISVEAPRILESVSEVSSSRVEAPVKASAPKVEARRSSPRVSAESPSPVESVPPLANLDNPYVTSVRFNPTEDPTFQKLDKYSNTYFNVAENSLYKELGNKVVQLQFNQAGNLSEGYIALKTPGTNGEYNINSKVNFVKGEMFIAGKKAPDALQDWAKKMQGEYDSYGKM
jgi:hypothetical protein